MNLFNARRARFELRNLRHWIKRRVGQLIDGQLLTPMIRNEDRVRSNGAYYKHGKHSLTATGDDAHTFTVIDLELQCGFRMNLDVGFGTLLDKKTDSPGLIAGEILIDDATARQYQRKLVIRNFFWRLVFNCVKLSFAIRMVKAFLEESRRTRMIFRRTGPEDSVVLFDLFPGYAVVIRIAAAGGDPQLIEDLQRRIKRKILSPTHPSRNLLHDPPILSRFTRWIVGFVNLYNTAFAVAGHAFIFTPRRAG